MALFDFPFDVPISSKIFTTSGLVGAAPPKAPWYFFNP